MNKGKTYAERYNINTDKNGVLDSVINRLFELERFDLDPQWNGEFTELERRIESTGEYVSWRSIRNLISEIRKENSL